MKKLSKLLTWLYVFITLMVIRAPISAQDQQIWVENWDEGWHNRWSYYGGVNDNCTRTQSGVLIQDCWSTALVSHQAFPVSQRIEFSGTIFSRPGMSSDSPSNLAHHVLFAVDDGPQGEYCGVYIWYDQVRRRDRVLIISYPDHYYPPEDLEHKTHEVTITWVPLAQRTGEGAGRQVGNCFYHLDGEQIYYTPYSFVQPEVTLWQGATSVNSGEGNNGTTSFAEHGEITVTVGW